MEMCILQQNKLVSFAEKMSSVKKRPVVPRCLFGPPDPAENLRLLQEEMQRERDRFQRRFNIDLDALEEAVQKTTSRKCEEEARIPPLPADLEERLTTSAPLDKDTKSARSIPGCERSLGERKCRKPCSKFQKRIRVSGIKRQTHLTDFWRSRRSVSFVLGKSKALSVAACLQVQELLEKKAPGRE